MYVGKSEPSQTRKLLEEAAEISSKLAISTFERAKLHV